MKTSTEKEFIIVSSLKRLPFFILLVTGLIEPLSADFKKIELGQTCSYFGEHVPKSVYTFASDPDAENVIDEIMSISGLPANFSVKSAGVPNAAAVVIANQRYILYNQAFMYEIKQQTGSHWAAYSIMAHEVGHHLSGHTLNDLGSRPNLELEADRYSGFILQKLGASLNDAKLVMESIGSVQASATHPAKHDRLAAISNGWLSSCTNDSSCSSASDRSKETISNESSFEAKIKAMSQGDIKLMLSEHGADLTEDQLSALDNEIAERIGDPKLLAALMIVDKQMKSEIKKTQIMLNKLQCDAGTPDGIPGQKTLAAVIRFFKYNHVGDAALVSKIDQFARDYPLIPNDGVESNIRRTKLLIDWQKHIQYAIARFGRTCN